MQWSTISLSHPKTIFPEADGKVHVFVYLRLWFWSCVIFAGQIKSNSTEAFSLTLQTAPKQNIAFTQAGVHITHFLCFLISFFYSVILLISIILSYFTSVFLSWSSSLSSTFLSSLYCFFIFWTDIRIFAYSCKSP